MQDERPPDNRTPEEIEASYRYWQSRTPGERFDESVRLSIEHYGMPKGTLRDGPVVKYRINDDGSREVISVSCGPNPLRHE